MQKDKLKQYSGLLIIGILLIVVYKVFEPSWFSVLLNACFPIIIGGVLAYFLEPLVQMVTKLFENCQSSFLKKHRRVLSVLLVSLAVILMIILFHGVKFVCFHVNRISSFQHVLDYFFCS